MSLAVNTKHSTMWFILSYSCCHFCPFIATPVCHFVVSTYSFPSGKTIFVHFPPTNHLLRLAGYTFILLELRALSAKFLWLGVLSKIYQWYLEVSLKNNHALHLCNKHVVIKISIFCVSRCKRAASLSSFKYPWPSTMKSDTMILDLIPVIVHRSKT